MSKVKQKVSGCFRTRQYAEAYCRISSHLQPMTNKGYNPLVAIQMALSGQLYADGGWVVTNQPLKLDLPLGIYFGEHTKSSIEHSDWLVGIGVQNSSRG